MSETAAEQPADDVLQLYEQATEAYDSGDMDAAVGYFQSILALAPDHVMSNYYAGVIARERGHLELSRQFFERAAIGLKPVTYAEGDDRELWLMLISALAGQGDWPAVAESIMDARDFVPGEPTFLHDIGVQLVNAAFVKEGLALLEEAVEGAPGVSLLLKNRGEARARMGFRDDAIADYKAALELAPDDVELYDLLAEIHGCSNLTADEAAVWMRRGLALDPTPNRYLTLAERLRVHARFEDAVEALREGLTHCGPKDAVERCELLQSLGINLDLAGRREEAVAAWQQSLEANEKLAQDKGEDIASCSRAARLLWRLRRQDEARAMLRRLRGDAGPQDYTYPLKLYSKHMAGAMGRLQSLVGGRDVFVLQHGPSIGALSERIQALAGADVCFMAPHGFAFFEQGMLAPIGAQVELALISNPMVLRAHVDQIRGFFARDGSNLLISSRFCFDQAGEKEMDARAAEAKYGDRLLYFPPPGSVLLPCPASPLQFPLCNTLSCMLPFLVLGGAARVFLFGVDGVGRDAVGGHERFGTGDANYRYAPADEHEKHMLSLSLLVDTLTFDFAAELGLLGTSMLYDRPVPPIFNVSPDSHIGLFPKIGLDECLELVVPARG